MAKQDVTLNIKALFDTSDIKNKVGDLQNAFKNVKLPDNLSKDFNKAITDLVNAANDFESKASKKISTKADAKSIGKSIDNVLKNFTKVEDVVDKIQSEINNSIDLSNIIQLDDTAIKKISKLREEIKDLRQQIADITTGKIDEVNTKLANIKSKGAKAGAEKAIQLFNNGEIEEAIELLEKVKQKQEQIANPESGYNEKAKATATENIKAIAGLIKIFTEAQKEVSGITDEINNKTEEIGNTAQQSYQKTTGGVNNAAGALKNYNNKLRETRNAAGDAAKGQAEFNSELDSIKSRISYFFGLNNAIQLVKRTIRDAYETIKSLDKAMTETAVVTDFSVGDMWAQLPEYTKRANELGITTQAAYEAATLYYQQGLKTNEVMAVSNETLKMARIAGLDAAEATDRMTNALRGFNMEITEANAQRIDDVYSRLAAISASNVDEISTAMTKVASLAHNAGSEFETTAAFLAQIIETTRESAETAGTALKTVYARFTEVKSLYSEGDLKGQDEEGEIIDVNRVSQALRTAGIDLNKFFLGEVGIDDIFMELASKWDSLTTLQQRYIATQAAGSRQQSRFIALMSDYARTQELVGEAYNANGAAAKQFAKTQDSLESKLARLKNAWNEFAMGITNSDVIKWGVDRLTDILTIINNLTTGFGALNSGVGSFISTFAKLTVLFSGLKVGKGLTSGLLNSTLASLLGREKIDFSQAAAEAMNVKPGKNLLATLRKGAISPFIGIGKGIGTAGKYGWGLAKGLGGAMGIGTGGLTGSMGALSGVLSTGGAGIAAGMAGLGTALLGVGVAAIAAYKAYKLWEKYTPEGQLKVAKKNAEELEKTAQKANEVAKSYKNIQENYQQYTDAVDNASTSEERESAIKSQNDYLLSLLEQDKTLAQYIKSTKNESGQIVLTLDEKSFAEAVKNATEEAVKANTEMYFAQATLQNAQTAVDEKRLSQLRGQLIHASMYGNEEEYAQLQTEYIQQQSVIEADKATVQSYAKLGYLSTFNNLNVNDEIANSLSNILSQIFDETGRLSENQLIQLSGWATSKNAQNIISAMLGNGNVDFLNAKTDEDFLSILGINSDELQIFADITGDSVDNLKNFIVNIAKSNKIIQENNKKRLQQRLNDYGISNNTQSRVFSEATLERQQSIDKTLEYADGLFNIDGYESLINTLLDSDLAEEDITEIQAFLDRINLDNPLKSFNLLQEGLKNSNIYIQTIAQNILKTNSLIFNSGNLVRTALAGGYGEVSEEVEKLVAENGKITPEELTQLAEKSETLSALLDSNVISARTLAKTLTLVGNGSIEFENINDSILIVLDNMYTFDDVVNEVHDFISNFNEGLDFGEGIDFLTNKISELEELTNNWEFGNERTQRLWSMFFGTDYVQDWGKGEDWMRERIQQMKTWLEDDGYGFFSDKNVMEFLGITEDGDHKLTWNIDQYKTLDELIEKITKQFGISTDAAKMFLDAFASHGDIEFYKQLQGLSLNSAIDAIKTEYSKGRTFWSNEELSAIANQFGMSLDDLKNRLISEVQDSKIGNFNFYDAGGLTGGNLFKKFQEDLEVNKQNFDKWIKNFIDDGELKIDQLRNALSQMGYDEFAQNDLISQIIQDKNVSKTIGLDDLLLDFEDTKVTTEDGETLRDKTIAAITTAINEETLDAALTSLSASLSDEAELDPDSISKIIGWVAGQFTGKPLDLSGLTAQLLSITRGDKIKTSFILWSLAKYIKDDGSLDLSGIGTFLNTLDIEASEKQEIIKTLATTLLDAGYPLDLSGLQVLLRNLNIPEEDIEAFLEAAQKKINEKNNLTATVDLIPGETSDSDSEQNEKRIETGEVETHIQELEDIHSDQGDYFSTRRDILLMATDEAASVVNSILQALQTQMSEDIIQRKTAGITSFSTPIYDEAEINKAANTIEGIFSDAGLEASVSFGQEIEGEPYTIVIDWTWGTGPDFNIQRVFSSLFNTSSSASGGYYSTPTTALTGEEDPEIVWNKQQGYAYITGANGPEFRNLNPGDQVFDAAETKKILQNSKKSNNIFNSYAQGRWNPSANSNSSGPSSSSDDSDQDKWKNELDWLYNLVEDIAELERIQTKLQEEYNDYLKDQSKNGRDLYNLLIKQLGNLYTQLDHQTFALEQREREMREFMDTTNKYDEYLSYNWQDRTLEIDWDAIEALQDKDTYEEIKELVSEAESIQDKMDDAEDSVQDIRNQIEELENIWRDTYVDFEERVLDAIVKSYQTVIDNYSELNDTLNNSNSEILDALQKQISLERQIRDNTKTEQDIADQEARLAFLRRDTTGSNELSALQLSSQLDESREAYEDNLIDQAIAKLQEDNDEAAAQRQKQIEIMQAQLDYQSENGEFNAAVRELLESAMDSDGKLLTDSELYRLLQSQENWQAMSEVSKQVWEEELQGTFKEVAAFILKQNAQENGTYITALTAAITGISSTIGSYSQALTKMSTGSRSSSSSSSSSGSPSSTTSATSTTSSDKNRTLDLEEELKDIDPRKRRTGGCFAKGTKILMANNIIKNIEDIKINELVIAYDEEKNIFVLKKVTKSYIHHNTPSMVRITFTNNDILELTPGHPLYSTNGWKSLDIENSLYEHGTIATLLHVGDEIIGINENKIVQSIEYLNIGMNYDSYNIEVEDCHTFLANGLVAHNMKIMGAYATGGLASATGLAWLDGTPSEPEYVLNARQTDAFLQLADILPSMMQNGGATNATTFGGVTLNLVMNVDQIASDYDVDRIADRVKSIIYDAGSYRNVNTLNFSR